MKLQKAMRAEIFWIIDTLKGRQVSRNYEEIRNLLENPCSTEAEEKRKLYLHMILKHASETVPFYRSHTGSSSLKDFPIINKSVIKEGTNRFISCKHKADQLHKVTTSGSTGAPLTVLQDKGKRLRHEAENIYLSELAGHKFGTRLYYLRVWNAINKKNLLNSYAQNIKMIDTSKLSNDCIGEFLDALRNDKSDKTILAFSSTLEAISGFIEQQQANENINVASIIAISETLPDGSKNELEKYFKCKIVSRYSNIENGLLAQQCKDESGEYHLNNASFHIELLHPDKDELVNAGETGRVVITDLFNFGMPLIRYDTGDMAILSEKSLCGLSGPVFTKVEGRKVDFIFDTEGNLLSPHTITNTMWKYSGDIKQFQFIQNTKSGYEIIINPSTSWFAREDELLNDLKNFVGADAEIQITYVDEIPILASGKRRKIVNNYREI